MSEAVVFQGDRITRFDTAEDRSMNDIAPIVGTETGATAIIEQ